MKSGKLENRDDVTLLDFSELTVLEAADLAKMLEEKWGHGGAPVALVTLVAPSGQTKQRLQAAPDAAGRKPRGDRAGAKRRPVVIESDEADPSPDQMDEVKQQALEILSASALDTPERHLAYVRKALAGVG